MFYPTTIGAVNLNSDPQASAVSSSPTDLFPQPQILLSLLWSYSPRIVIHATL